MEGDSIRENLLLGMGNPLLDISAVVDKNFLEKYEMKENNAILADEKHKTLYDEITEKYEASYIAGGSVQNTLRVAQWLLGKSKVCTFFGCVGKDKYSKILYDEATSSGVNVRYQYNEKEPTGTCGVLLTGHNRSLCANLGSANHFTIDHLKNEENEKLIDTAQFYYVSGFFLTVNPEAQMELAKVALANNRPFIMNLSAPFICQFHIKALSNALPYVDLLFGNESEAETLSESLKLGTKNIEEIALKLSNLPKENNNRKRIVIITQGVNPTIVAFNGTIRKFPVKELSEEKIVDTNGAGDAFAGGFLSQYILGKSLEVCIKCGSWAAAEIIQRNGCSFEGKPCFDPEQ
ncbi:uncharacterized protein LOC130899324 [Diorhabda carinulata]|uniref:uncharacterized protein LOC130899324 n=1 Tax=Diorhabda carinulata TaxID=1163345 RepID=UPI0025A045C6|nr:uncharacterized protein LOC130899324 [Diorhabda carinulata]